MEPDARRYGLAHMKRLALALLVAAAVVFVIARIFESAHPWLGYVRATAEAAMVGACADWFAVTALFRHPLGVKIPHTAIIPTRKDEIGVSLGAFLEENFLSDAAVAQKLKDAHVAARAADWLLVPGNNDVVTDFIAQALSGVLDVLSDEDVHEAIDQAVTSKLTGLPLAPIAGRALDVVTESGRHHELFEAGLKGLARLLTEQRDTFRQRLAKESPWWVPEAIDERIFDKIFVGVMAFVDDVLADQNHELRAYVDQRLETLIDELQSSPEMAARAEDLKAEFLAHPAVRNWSASLWSDAKTSLLAQSSDPTSALRRRISSTVTRSAHAIAQDADLRVKVDGWINGAITYLVRNYRHEVGKLIAATVKTWDPIDTSDRIEAQIGRDLQFIRINGTLVGGLVGLVIYSVSQLFS